MPNWTDDNGVSHFMCKIPGCCGNPWETAPRNAILDKMLDLYIRLKEKQYGRKVRKFYV